MNKHRRMIPFTSYFPPELYERLKKVNKKTKIPMAALIREALEEVVAQYHYLWNSKRK